jgi:hypothetical protein
MRLQPKQPKILAIDIETAPHSAHVWGLFKQNIALNQLMETGRVLCFSWKWLRGGDSKVIGFVSELDGTRKMLDKAWELLSEADIIVTYNGKRFDVPTLNKEFIEQGFSVAKREFRFASNKMDHLAQRLGIKTKVRHSGHGLWVRCMAGDEKAWKEMTRYNKRDVLILDKLYYRMLPWIKGHPNVTLYRNEGSVGAEVGAKPQCPTCGSPQIQRRGVVHTKTRSYVRFCCTSCSSWSRSSLALPRPNGRELVQGVV